MDWKKILGISGLGLLCLVLATCGAYNLTEGTNKMSYCSRDDCCDCGIYHGSALSMNEFYYGMLDVGCSCCACVNHSAVELIEEKYGRTGCVHGFQDHCRLYQQDTGEDPHCFYGGSP